MCLTCGCRDYFNDHGDERNITMDRLQNAAHAAGVTVPEALANMQRGVSDALRGMTDWTSAGGDATTLVLDNYAEPEWEEEEGTGERGQARGNRR
jgi:hypothetical protein